MPRRAQGPRLYLDPKRKAWVIRDGPRFVRTGCTEEERSAAEKQLAHYIGQKHKPQDGPDPMIAEVLLAYTNEHLPQTKSAANAAYCIASLGEWWGMKRTTEINAATCRAYAATKTPAAGRRDLETLRAALRYWHREHGPLTRQPAITLPRRNPPRDRWLTHNEAARFLKAARHVQHLRRFFLIGLYTGSRSGDILGLRWSQVDLSAGVMVRKASGEAQDKRKRAPPVRLGRRLLSHLRRWKRQDGPVDLFVCHYNGGRVRKLRRSWKEARERAGLDPSVTPHVLRHTRATWLMQDGTPIWEAAGFLGMSPEVLEAVYGKHHPAFQGRAAGVR